MNYNGNALYSVGLRLSSNTLLTVVDVQKVYLILCGIFRGSCMVEAGRCLGNPSSDAELVLMKGSLMFTIRFIPDDKILWLNTLNNKMTLREVEFDIFIQKTIPVCIVNTTK